MDKKLRVEDIRIYITSSFDNMDINTNLKQFFELRMEPYPKHINWRFVLEYGFETTDIMLVADRWETAKELAKRIERSKRAKISAKKRKKKRELADRKSYEKLKAKYRWD
jgi:hypothetical protein